MRFIDVVFSLSATVPHWEINSCKLLQMSEKWQILASLWTAYSVELGSTYCSGLVIEWVDLSPMKCVSLDIMDERQLTEYIIQLGKGRWGTSKYWTDPR